MTLRIDPADVARLLPDEPRIGLAPTPWELAAEWLIAHPRGEIRMRAAGEMTGFIVERSCPDLETGHECADASHGFHPELAAALAACMREGE